MSDPKFQTWKSYYYGNIRLFYPPNHAHEQSFEEIAKGYSFAVSRIRQLLVIDSLPDTITVFYFTGPNQGLSLTGQTVPFADSEAVYYWPNYSRGVSLTQHLLLYWSNVKPVSRFLWHGIVALFDFAGENYHKTTVEYSKDTTFIPLARLAVDTTMNSNFERYQSAEAASFVAFILAEYGPRTLKRLYESTEPFNTVAPLILGKPVDSVEQDWLAFARLNVPSDTTGR